MIRLMMRTTIAKDPQEYRTRSEESRIQPSSFNIPCSLFSIQVKHSVIKCLRPPEQKMPVFDRQNTQEL